MSLTLENLYGSYGLQGLPRPGLRRFGVPPGGAFDQECHRIANALVCNAGDEPCLEMGLCSGEMLAKDPLRLAVVGCDLELDGEQIESGTAFDIQVGQELKMEYPRGARAYLSVEGGWLSIKENHLLANSVRSSNRIFKRLEFELNSLVDRPLRVLSGPDTNDAMIEGLLSTQARVTQQIDRVGLRLDANLSGWQQGASSPCCQGVVQRTEDGSLILFGPDGPTVGGYSKIAVVIRADWNHSGQLKPGDTVQFELVTLQQALDLWRRGQDLLNQRCAELCARA